MRPAELDQDLKTLLGNEPFPWQRRLLQAFLQGRFPSSCDIPTGLGKTSVIALWLLALAQRGQRGAPARFPRRLIYVVDRRTVVDQATDETDRIRENLKQLPHVSSALRALAAVAVEDDDLPLAISTLRGQFADNGEWRLDPARPAVIVGTVDMIGSRLLFSGYGCGFRSRPLHAAFLGQDALLVLDEAHLAPAFHELAEAVAREQGRSHDPWPLSVMALTATASRSDPRQPFTLDDEDRQHTEVTRRLRSRKGLRLHPLADAKKTAERLAELALAHQGGGQAILIFARKVEDVEAVRGRLEKAVEKKKIQVLTGTMRGYERDRLAQADRVFARFLRKSEAAREEGTVYLICTSAGEVGVDLSADHLICDLTPYDSMAQRLGRVNRFGDGDARIDVVHQTHDESAATRAPYDEACARTLPLLQDLPLREDGCLDASPAALMGLDGARRRDASSPRPVVLPTTDVLLDAWALTTLTMPRPSLRQVPGRPLVADWLHGVSGWEPPETQVAWRQEVDEALHERYPPAELLADYPLKPHELLRGRSDRVFDELERIAARHPEKQAWVLDGKDEVLVCTLAEIVQRGKEALEQRTVLLPPSVGGLTATGMLAGSDAYEEARAEDYDIADRWGQIDGNAPPRRCRVWDDDAAPKGMRLVRTIRLQDEEEVESPEGEEGAPRKIWYWFTQPRHADDDGSRSALKGQELDAHLRSTESFAARLTDRLGLREGFGDEAAAVRLAARWHDQGKARQVWQRSIGNYKFNQGVVLAKSEKSLPAAELTRYRHEFGSLLDVAQDAEFTALSDPSRDLVLHLIAAHHGRARPHFPPEESFDPDHPSADAGRVAQEVPRRFARLQRRYGRWGLAYLESLVRAADALASQRTDVPALQDIPRSATPRPVPVPDASPPSLLRVAVDVTNPGHFFAACGLLELADRLAGPAEGWFEGGMFHLRPAREVTVMDLLDALLREQAQEVLQIDWMAAEPLIAPLRLSLGEGGPLLLDAWMTVRREKGEAAARANPPWNFWSGQQTSMRIWRSLREALQDQMDALRRTDPARLFAQRRPLSGRFGFDPGAAWNALDVGFSPNEQKLEVASSPAVELLGAVGLQRFRPRLGRSDNGREDRSIFDYAAWALPLPPAVAAAAAAGLIPSGPGARLRGRVVSRGSYAALGYATPLQGERHD